MEAFISQMGYEPVLFEKGDITFSHDLSLETSCLQEIDLSDVLILIIGGRYGAISKEDQELARSSPDHFFGTLKSVTQKEYLRALERHIPTYTFVESGVYSEYRTYKENRGNESIKFAHADDIRIFELVGYIFEQRRGNYVKPFDKIDDIIDWLRDQWAGLLFESLRQRPTDARIKGLEAQIKELSTIVESLKRYSEAIVRKVDEEDSEELIAEVNTDIQRELLDDLEKHPFIQFFVDAKAPEGEERPARKTTDIVKALELASSYPDFLERIHADKKLTGFSLARDDFSDLRKRVEKFPAQSVSPFLIGDRISHHKYGAGTVKDIHGNKLTIDFDKAGSKRVLDSFVERH